jgi:hypothetical protein
MPSAATTRNARVCAALCTRGVSGVRVRAALACGLAYVVSSACAPVRADDWLALLPACSMPAPSLPSLELIYPQPDLPALIEAGEELVTRVRLPAALTPPPGMQQERVLRGWFAELVGRGVAVGGAPASHRHSLPIITVRPDSGSSLVYRIRVLVPAYVAPSVYSMLLRTPFGERWAELSVHVVAPGLRSRPAHGPEFAVAGRSLALRVAGELWVSEGCPEGGASFEAEVASTLQFERRSRAALQTRLLPPMAAQVIEREQLAEHDVLGADTLRIDNSAQQVTRSVLVLLPAKRSLRVRAAQLILYPAGDLAVHTVESISALLNVPAGAHAELELGPEVKREHALALEPRLVASGLPTQLRIRGAAPNARVAYDYGYGRSALTGPVLMADFAGPLEQPLRALVLTPAGGGELVRQRVVVTPRRPPSCSIGGPRRAAGAGRPLRLAAFSYLLGLASLLKRRRRRWVWE